MNKQIEQLIYKLTNASFLDEAWGRKPVHIKSNELPHFDALASENNIWKYIKNAPLLAKNVRILNQDGIMSKTPLIKYSNSNGELSINAC